jgi:leucyl-tRNA synthetase
MDGFACSSWYFLRFADPHNDKEPFSKAKADFWLPVDDYIGGAEHAVMHLLYARFWTKVMYDQKLIDFQEPFSSLHNQGMILAPDGIKMSKSKGNTIEPDNIIDQGYGADSIRIMELFIGPWNQTANWSVEGMGGSFKFLQRVWTLVQEYNEAPRGDSNNDQLNKIINRTVKKVSEDLRSMSFNTAISALMECVNDLYKIKAKDKYSSKEWPQVIEDLLKLLSPFAPHITEELWHEIGFEESIHLTRWPEFNDEYLQEDSIQLVIQVNGKLRATINAPLDISEEDAIKSALDNPTIKKYTEGKELKKNIYVPKKLINFVI